MYGLTQTIAPTAEPITTTYAKQHSRIFINSEDNLISDYITAARESIEDWTGRQIMPATYQLGLDGLSHDYNQWAYGMTPSMLSFPNNQWAWQRPLLLPKPPCLSVASIQYFDGTGTLQTLATSQYVVDTTRKPARIMMLSYPTLDPLTIPRVLITYSAGYAVVPTRLKMLVAQLACTLYQQREANTDMKLTDCPYGFRSMLNAYRIWDFNAFGSGGNR
jgi:hypothetical protein